MNITETKTTDTAGAFAPHIIITVSPWELSLMQQALHLAAATTWEGREKMHAEALHDLLARHRGAGRPFNEIGRKVFDEDCDRREGTLL